MFSLMWLFFPFFNEFTKNILLDFIHSLFRNFRYAARVQDGRPTHISIIHIFLGVFNIFVYTCFYNYLILDFIVIFVARVSYVPRA